MYKQLVILALILGCASFTLAQDIGLKSIAPKVSILLPQEDGLEAGFGIGVAANLGEVADGIGLFPFAIYEMPGTEFSSLDVSNIQIGADVHYGVAENIYVGGGASLNFFSTEVDLGIFGGTVDNSETEFGLSVLGGYDFNISDMQAAAEARFDLIDNYNHLEISVLVYFPM